MNRIIISLFFSWIAFSQLLCQDNPVVKQVEYGGYQREYLLYLPKNHTITKPYNLVVCLHGFNRQMDDFFGNYNIASVADSLDLIVLAPQALPEQDPNVIAKAAELKQILGLDIPLDAAWGCGLRVKATLLSVVTLLDEELNKNIDDTGFINDIVAQTMKDYNVNGENRFLFGTSMGGFMSYQFALQHGNDWSGLISVCGSMGTAIDNAGANVALAVCDFHSIDDEVVPYQGTYEMMAASVSLCWKKEDVIRAWINKNGAQTVAQTEDIHYYPSNSPVSVTKYTYHHPENEVIHYQLKNAHHSDYMTKDKDCMDYNEEIIKFLKSHIKSVPTGIESPVVHTLAVMPNPADNYIRLDITEGNVLIYDLSGNTALTANLNGKGEIDITSLNAGFYMIRVVNNNSAFVGKFLKK